MQAERSQVPRAAFLLAGVAVGALSRLWGARNSRQIADLRRQVSELRLRVEESQTGVEERIARVETRIEEHEVRLKDVPSTGQIVAAMEDLLGRTMHSLDQRLSAQADSIELLKTTVSQTDNLLERVLESLDALRQEPPADGADEDTGDYRPQV
jgi:hypothetical protein